MAALGMLLLVVGWAGAAIGSLAILVVAFKESIFQAICLCIPFYGLYYVITRWETCKKGFLLSIGGGVAAVLGTIVGAMGAA